MRCIVLDNITSRVNAKYDDTDVLLIKRKLNQVSNIEYFLNHMMLIKPSDDAYVECDVFVVMSQSTELTIRKYDIITVAFDSPAEIGARMKPIIRYDIMTRVDIEHNKSHNTLI